MPPDFTIVHPDDVPTDQFTETDTAVRKLTEPLGCTEVRVNQVILEPGEVSEPHRHPDQEEVFVAQTDGQIAIDGEVHDVPQGAVVRVAPDAIRNLLNRTSTRHVWLAIGAPPVGTVDDFGAYELPD